MIYVFAPTGSLPAALREVDALAVKEWGGSRRTVRPHVRLVTDEAKWRRTDFYCSTAGGSRELELTAQRLGAEVIYLPEHRDQFSGQVVTRYRAGYDVWVRMAARTDSSTMLALAPAETPGMF